MTGTHVNTQRTHSCSFLMREKPLSRKSVMSPVAGCKKLSLRLCLTLAMPSFLLNPPFFFPAVRTVHVTLPSLHPTFAHLTLINFHIHAPSHSRQNTLSSWLNYWVCPRHFTAGGAKFNTDIYICVLKALSTRTWLF